jgi:hypothetical protein
MDEGTRGLEAIDRDVAEARDDLDVLLAELDRRRHEWMDVRLQLTRHAPGIVLTVAAFVIAASGLVWLDLRRRRARERLTARGARLRDAVSRMVDRPERVAAEPTIPGKIVAAAASAAAASLVKKLVEHGVRRLMDAAPAPRSAAAEGPPVAPVERMA